MSPGAVRFPAAGAAASLQRGANTVSTTTGSSTSTNAGSMAVMTRSWQASVRAPVPSFGSCWQYTAGRKTSSA